MQRGTNKLKPPVSAVIDDGSYPSFVCSNVSMLVTTSRAALDNASCQPEGTTPTPKGALVVANGNTIITVPEGGEGGG